MTGETFVVCKYLHQDSAMVNGGKSPKDWTSLGSAEWVFRPLALMARMSQDN